MPTLTEPPAAWGWIYVSPAIHPVTGEQGVVYRTPRGAEVFWTRFGTWTTIPADWRMRQPGYTEAQEAAALAAAVARLNGNVARMKGEFAKLRGKDGSLGPSGTWPPGEPGEQYVAAANARRARMGLKPLPPLKP